MARLVKRYSNRKLYDTSESRYVTLDEIARWVKGGEEVKILENESGEDLTAVTFAQIILEEERKKSGLLSLRVMRELIQHGESALHNLAATVESGIEAIRPAAEAAERAERVQESVQGLTSIADRLTDIQRNFDEVVRRQVERVTANPTLQRELQRIERTARMLEARIARLRPGAEDEPTAPTATAAGADELGRTRHRRTAVRRAGSFGGPARLRSPPGQRARNTGALAVAQHVLRRAAEHHLDDAGVAVRADEEQVVAAVAQHVDDALVRRARERPQRHRDLVRLEVALRLREHAVALAAALLRDVDHGERQAERRRQLRGGVQRRAGALRAVVGEQRAGDLLPAERRDEHGLRALAGDRLGGAAEQPGRELLVDAAVPDDDQVGDAGLVADLVGHDAHGQRGLAGTPACSHFARKASSRTLPRSWSASRILDEKSR